MTNNGPGYEGQRVCHLRTMANMGETLVARKGDLNDIFGTKIFNITFQFPGPNGHACSDNFDSPISYFASHMTEKLTATFSTVQTKILFSNLHPISKGFDCDGGCYC